MNRLPFNVRYGFSRGEETIRLTTRKILSLRDIVGYLGDDFIIILQSTD